MEHLLGIAMGRIGMSMDDFCRCTPSEFYAAYEAWNEMQTNRERGRWERVRMQCLCSMQPYSKSKLAPQDIMRFPWEERGKSEEEGVKNKKPMSREEIMERYRAAKKRAGL